ncbi:MAG: host attachment protein [Mesorhizobium sp.]|nr:host attachment protein [Mesorhizobium sp.]TIS55836.1 MAG: host attachment protein [Mesorhizobium sp.]
MKSSLRDPAGDDCPLATNLPARQASLTRINAELLVPPIIQKLAICPMKLQSTWVVVADGARARILRDVLSAGETPDEREDLVFHSERRQLREIMADKPGRSFASTGARRSAMEYHADPVREEDRALAATLAETLHRHHLAGDLTNWSSLHRPRCWAIFARPFRKASVRSQLQKYPRISPSCPRMSFGT